MVDYLMKKLYGTKSEKSSVIGIEQLSLFDEAEVEQDENAVEPTLEDTIDNTAKKFKGQRKLKLKDLPHKKITFDVYGDDTICPTCGTELKQVGEEFVRSEVVFHPAKLYVVDYYAKTYECRKCRNTEDAIYVTVGGPEPVIPHSIASPSSVAYVMYQKYANHMPLYRQEQEWKNMGLDLSRQTMSNWVIIAANEWLRPLYNKMHETMVRENYLHADETRIQVMNEKNRKNTTDSYMWVFSTIENCTKPIRLFKYSPTRNGDIAKEFLDGCDGNLITDAYDGYEQVDEVTRCYCWAHARRKFVDALPSNIEDLGDTAMGVKYCNEIFKYEKEVKDKSIEEKKIKRQDKSKKTVDKFFLWAKQNKDTYIKNSKISNAINYALNQEEGLRQFLNDGNIPVSNNMADNSIRPFTVGRKNWLFSGSPKGADASALVYSLIETAKVNNLNPFKYLERIFKDLPGMCFDEYPEYLDDYMPWSDYIQQHCGKENLTSGTN